MTGEKCSVASFEVERCIFMRLEKQATYHLRSWRKIDGMLRRVVPLADNVVFP